MLEFIQARVALKWRMFDYAHNSFIYHAWLVTEIGCLPFEWFSKLLCKFEFMLLLLKLMTMPFLF